MRHTVKRNNTTNWKENTQKQVHNKNIEDAFYNLHEVSIYARARNREDQISIHLFQSKQQRIPNRASNNPHTQRRNIPNLAGAPQESKNNWNMCNSAMKIIRK